MTETERQKSERYITEFVLGTEPKTRDAIVSWMFAALVAIERGIITQEQLNNAFREVLGIKSKTGE